MRDEQAGRLRLQQRRRGVGTQAVLRTDVALAGEQLRQKLVGVGNELDRNAIQVGQPLVGAIVVRVARQTDAFAERPPLNDKGAVADRPPVRLVGLHQLRGAELAPEVLRQRLPEVDEVGAIGETGQACPARGQFARGLIGGGTLDHVLGGRCVRVGGQVEAVDGVGGADGRAVGPDGRPHGEVDDHLVGGDGRAVERHRSAVGGHEGVAHGQRADGVIGPPHHVPRDHLNDVDDRVAVGQTGNLLQPVGLIVIGKVGDVVGVKRVADGLGRQHRLAVDVDGRRLLGHADDQFLGPGRAGSRRGGGQFDNLGHDAGDFDGGRLLRLTGCQP